MDPNNQSLPFLTRKMLDFEHATVFSLRIRSKSLINQKVQIRGMTQEGVFTLSHTLITTGVEQTETFRIPNIPIMVCVTDEGNLITQGFAYITLDLLVNGDKLLELCSGLVYQSKSISWPITNTSDKRPDGGFLTTVTGTNPAAGADIIETVPTNEIWKLKSIRVRFVTDANVANRRIQLFFNINGTYVSTSFADVDQAASLARIYTFAPYGVLPATSYSDKILVVIPDNIVMTGGSTIETLTTNKQATDNFDSPIVYVEKYFV